ncbi:MAG: CAP domain-containing protein, partial [Chloroflexota bacterium]
MKTRTVKTCLLAFLALALLLPLYGQSARAAAAPAAAAPASGLAAKATKTPRSTGGAAAGAPSPYDVIAAVNSVRAAHGLAGFTTNGALMAAAQAHSDYQAAIDSTTHTGSGGTTVKTRALAAGYGGGADVSVIENIYGGMGASVQNAVGWWQGDAIHLNTLLAERQTDAGAGVAVSASGVVYFTLDVGAVVGGSAPVITGGGAPAAAGGDAAAGAGAAAVSYNPIALA